MTRRSAKLAWGAAALTLLAHLLGNPHYGFFRDELYFIVCGRHPAFGFVDQPPLTPLLAAASQLFGHSLFALRAISAVCAATAVFVTCLVVRELEGGVFAELLAALAVALAPVLIAFGTLVTTDMLGLWAWPLLTLLVIRQVKGAPPRGWLWVGAAVALAGNAKYSVFFLVLALVGGLLLTPERKVFATRWFAAGLGLAAALLLPNFLWQAVHGFPMLELLHNGQLGKNVQLSPAGFLLQQAVLLTPLLALLALMGLGWLFSRAQWRWLGLSLLLLFALMVGLHAKAYYPADVYPVAFAAGAVAVEGLTQRRRALRPVIAGLVVLLCAPFAPLALPILSEQTYLAYAASLRRAGVPLPSPGEHHAQAALGQVYADMHGWPQLAATVARVYRSLPPEQRAKATIAASNYGEAAAIDFFGASDGLPPVLSGHNQYFLWGPHGASGDVVIDVNGDCGAQAHLFRERRLAATFSAPYVMPYEDQLPIWVCVGITRPLPQIWPSLKHYI